MKIASGPIYELTLSVDREVVDTFEVWLSRKIEEALQNPGIASANVYQLEDDEAGRARRIIHYRFVNDTDLEQFLAGQSAAASESLTGDFGNGLATAGRILRHADIDADGLKPPELCRNCGTALGGQYCGHCGQRATSRLISVWELLRDAFGDLFELDSRLWRTLIPLLVRPGRLTRDYLEGRRMRYMPPFRMYLVLSIVFFIIAFFDPHEELGILFTPGGEPPVEQIQDATDVDAIRDEIMRELADEGLVTPPPSAGSAGDANADAPAAEDPGGLVISISSNDDDGPNCDLEDIDASDWPQWLSSRMTKERLKAACSRVLADNGRAFLKKLADNVPAALFLLLPLMALVLKVLYPLSKRYYVEHLLFVVHYHAFVFLMLSLQVLLARLGALARIPEPPIDLVILSASFYVPVYLYKALVRVYGQRAFFTALKFLVLIFAYFSGLLAVFGLVVLFSVFSI